MDYILTSADLFDSAVKDFKSLSVDHCAILVKFKNLFNKNTLGGSKLVRNLSQQNINNVFKHLLMRRGVKLDTSNHRKIDGLLRR